MRKRTVFLLLMPNLIFLLVAAESFRFAKLLTPNEQITQKAIDKLSGEAKRGEYGATPDLLVERLSNSWWSYDVLRADAAKMYLTIAWAILAGVMVQVYLVLRLKYWFKNRTA